MQALKAAEKGDLKDWSDLWFNDNKRAGYVAVTDFKKTLFYGKNDVLKVKQATKGQKRQFISLNAFEVDWDNKIFSRATQHLKQIRNIAIDIDQYDIGLSIEEALDEIQVLILSNRIPEPNLVLTSRGIQLFYTITNGASPEIGWLASYITEQLIGKLKHLGADSNAKDSSRVMRVPESINERNNAVVTPYIWNDESYTLQELQAYCRPLEKFETRKRTKGKVIHLPVDERLAFFYKTNHARLSDLHKLVQLREGNLTSVRNIFLYMYSYHQSLVLNTQKDVLESVQSTFKDVYSRTDKPMSKKEFENTVKSAYKDAREFFESFKENGYKVIYKANDGIKKPYKSENAIRMLNITESEQMSMSSLRNKEIAKKQHADYMRVKRRADGTHKQSRAEYEADRQDKQRKLESMAVELRKQGKTHKKIAELLGVSRGRISQILKKVNGA